MSPLVQHRLLLITETHRAAAKANEDTCDTERRERKIWAVVCSFLKGFGGAGTVSVPRPLNGGREKSYTALWRIGKQNPKREGRPKSPSRVRSIPTV